MNRLILLRHGLTDANKKNLYCGRTDLPLNEEGFRVLRDLKVQYAYPAVTWSEAPDSVRIDGKPALILTSGLIRTGQTLEALFGDVPHIIDPRLNEMDFGVFEMRSLHDPEAAEYFRTWMGGMKDMKAPGGESSLDVVKRITPVIMGLMADPHDTVMLVIHGGPIMGIIRTLFPELNASTDKFRLQPTGGHGYDIRFDAGKPVSFVMIPKDWTKEEQAGI